MQRRDFLQASVTTTTAAAASAACGLAVAAPAPGTPRELYEWRTYRLDDEAKQARLHNYLKSAALPAWKNIGLGPVGVFTEIGPEARASIHVLLVYPTPDLLASA